MTSSQSSASVKRGPRNFDPVALGQAETDAWVAYYRKEWLKLLRASVAMVRIGFGMSWPRTLMAAWWVMRANQQWAPYPDNDPDAARESMRKFYAIVIGSDGLDLDPAEAAQREVEWWRIHRVHQREDGLSEKDLIDALCSLYAYVYGATTAAVRPAATHRTEAMRDSDRWVAEGCSLDSGLIAAERRALIASYTALLDAVS